MKVLVISLLRLGDFVETLPVLQALRTQFPVRRLDVLTHEPARALAPMIPDVTRWWTIDRDGLQEGLGRAEIPLLTSFSVLKEQLDEINSVNYDCIINLTQTHYSAWIAGYLRTANRSGLFFDAKGQMHVHSAWFRYLDEHAPLDVKDVFHYTDIFFYGSGLKGPERQWNMTETSHGRSEVGALNLAVGEKIVLQTLTSDSKKNWSEASWIAMLTQLQLFRPKAQFIVLGAPSEQNKIQQLVAKAKASGISAREAILSLEGAFSLLRQSQLLITGDTSIKHLANATEIPILELSLGSSDLRRTGAYKPGSLILQPVVACAPCPHSMPCSQIDHRCALTLSSEAVSTVAHHYLNGDSLKDLAREFANEVRVLKTRIAASGFWMACDVLSPSLEETVTALVERCTWKFLLSREFLNPLAQYGSEGIFMKRELEEIFPEPSKSEIVKQLDFLEQEAEALNGEVAGKLSAVRHLIPPRDENGIRQIGQLRRQHVELETVVQQMQIKCKLIRSLKSQLTEFQ